jgi:hypothetical protein
MSLLLIEKIYGLTDDGFNKGQVEMINTDDIKSIRSWHLHGKLKDDYPNGFTLITLKNKKEFKTAQSLIQVNERINGLKEHSNGESS